MKDLLELIIHGTMGETSTTNILLMKFGNTIQWEISTKGLYQVLYMIWLTLTIGIGIYYLIDIFILTIKNKKHKK